MAAWWHSSGEKFVVACDSGTIKLYKFNDSELFSPNLNFDMMEKFSCNGE